VSVQSSEDVQVEVILEAHAAVGEGPVWDERSQRLFWVDIMNSAVHVYDPATNQDRAIDVGQPVGALALREQGGLLLARRDGFSLLDDDFGNLRPLAPLEVEIATNRLNDGKAGPDGRFWGGTMAFEATHGAGAFYRLDPDASVTRMFGGVSISNGLDWTADQRQMYYIDSPTQGVDVFDFDGHTGTLSNRRRLITIPRENGMPDGMTVDAEGGLWVAQHGGGRVQRYLPDGRPDRVVRLPVSHVTCCAFGGPDYTDLYITSMTYGLEHAIRDEPLAGALFRCRPGVRGRPPFRFAG
jgi:sugar lactone lactonase YvrE